MELPTANFKLQKFGLLVILLGAMVLPVLAAKAPTFNADAAYGKLTIYSDISGSDIYVDAKYVGQDRATISTIPAGKHYVRVVKDDKNIQNGIVEVKEGEETIIVAKPDEELLSKMRKPNQVVLFGGMTGVNYSFPAGIIPGITSFDIKEQFGVGFQLKYPIYAIDTNIDVGFILNYPATIHYYDTKNALWTDGLLSISSPFIGISRNLFKIGQFKVDGGLGINYALYTPGGGLALSVIPKIGYLYYLETYKNIDVAQKLMLRLGYVNYKGDSGVEINSAGYFLQAGVAYQL